MAELLAITARPTTCKCDKCNKEVDSIFRVSKKSMWCRTCLIMDEPELFRGCKKLELSEVIELISKSKKKRK